MTAETLDQAQQLAPSSVQARAYLDGQAPENALLSALDAADLALLAPHMTRTPFAIGDMLAHAGDPIHSVFFPERSIAGILDAQEDGRRLAVGLVGSEGFIGWPLLLGATAWPHDVVMRAEVGTALRVDADALNDAMERSPALRTRLLGFTHTFMTQMASTIVSSLIHPVERRMARWILLYHDRVSGDDICLTHEEFRLMLGVRRSSITEALHRLEAEHAVRGLRGKVVVRDREKLMALAGSTYGPAEREYARLVEGRTDIGSGASALFAD